MSSQDQQKVRDEVARAYAAALERSKKAEGGCCGGIPASVAAQSAGYGESEQAAFSEAAQSSFGCGNPLAFAGVEPGQTVVDLGSGAGFDLLIASRKVGPDGHVIGIDMTDAMIEAARENAAKAGANNVEVRRGTIERLPVEDASVDWVVSNCVINLSPDKDRVFAEIARVLKPGGRFSISDIVVDDLPDELRRQAKAYSACIGGAISETEYVRGLATAGLQDVQVAERLTYTAEQLCGIVGTDLAAIGENPHDLDEAVREAAGNVHSVKVTGRKPPST